MLSSLFLALVPFPFPCLLLCRWLCFPSLSHPLTREAITRGPWSPPWLFLSTYICPPHTGLLSVTMNKLSYPSKVNNPTSTTNLITFNLLRHRKFQKTISSLFNTIIPFSLYWIFTNQHVSVPLYLSFWNNNKEIFSKSPSLQRLQYFHLSFYSKMTHLSIFTVSNFPPFLFFWNHSIYVLSLTLHHNCLC